MSKFIVATQILGNFVRAEVRGAIGRGNGQTLKYLLSPRASVFNHVYETRRTLFDSEILRLEDYRRQKAYLAERMGDGKESFVARMKDYVEGPGTNTIFTDDLKTMIYITGTDSELDILLKMVKRFHSQNNDLRFSNFTFGPLVMRLLHEMKKDELALQLYLDQTMTQFFNQRSSWLALMDLLYEQRRYDDTIKVMNHIWDTLRESRKQVKLRRQDADSGETESPYLPLDCITLSMAAAYKLNTPESLQKAADILKEVKNFGNSITLRSAVFGALLAVNQNKPEIALEILAVPGTENSRGTPVAYLNVKALTYIKLGRLSDALQLLKSILERDLPDQVNVGDEIMQDVLSEIKEAVLKSGDRDQIRKIEVIERSLRQTNRVAPLNLAQYLERPILRRRRLQDGYKQRQRPTPSGERLGVGRDGARRTGSRPGLLD